MLFLPSSVSLINPASHDERSDDLMTNTRAFSPDEDLRSRDAFNGLMLHRMAEDCPTLADGSGCLVLVELLVLRGIVHKSDGC